VDGRRAKARRGDEEREGKLDLITSQLITDELASGAATMSSSTTTGLHDEEPESTDAEGFARPLCDPAVHEGGGRGTLRPERSGEWGHSPHCAAHGGSRPQHIFDWC
jgi:hypothetical protein